MYDCTTETELREIIAGLEKKGHEGTLTPLSAQSLLRAREALALITRAKQGARFACRP